MSLYNLLFGRCESAGTALAMLGATTDKVPRFRDAYLFLDEPTKEPRIAIYTRTGGGNRYWYESLERRMATEGRDTDPSGPFNEDLRALPGFLYDRDDCFDNTYATFVYEVPQEYRDEVRAALTVEGVEPTKTPAEKMKALIASLAKKEG